MPAIRSKGRGGFYAVRVGRIPGVYTSWEECKEQTDKFKGARYKKSILESDAFKFMSESAPAKSVLSYSNIQSMASNVPITPVEVGSSPKCPPQNSGHPSVIDQAAMATVSAPRKFAAASLPPRPSVPYPVPRTTLPLKFSASHSVAPAQGPVFLPDPPPRATTVQLLASSSKTTHHNSSAVVNSLSDEAQSTWDVVYIQGWCIDEDDLGPMAGIGLWWGPDDIRNLSERCPGPKEAQRTTRAQFMAMLRLLDLTSNSGKPLLINTDSIYLINCFKTWVHEWKTKNWINAHNKPIKNADVIRCIAKRLEIRANLGQTIVLAHADRLAGSENARILAQQGSLLHPVPEIDLEIFTEFLEREVNQLIVRFNGNVRKADLVVLGSEGGDGCNWVESRTPRTETEMSSVKTLSAVSTGEQKANVALGAPSDTLFFEDFR